MFDGLSDPNKSTDPDLGDREWLIYPNPIQDEFNVLTSLNEPYSIEIYDVSGEMVYSSSENSGKATIDATGFSAGVYVIKLSNEYGNVYTEKVVKL